MSGWFGWGKSSPASSPTQQPTSPKFNPNSKFNKYGTVGKIASEEDAQAALDEYSTTVAKQEIDDPFLITREDLYIRFLIARKWDLASAKDALAYYNEWRKEFKTNEILTEDFEPKLAELYPAYFHGKDREGHPVYVERPDHTNIKELIKLHPPEFYLRWHVYTMERCRQLYKHMGTDRMSVVLDIGGVGYTMLADSKALGFLKAMAQLDQQVYPEHMRWMFIINAPSTFAALWKMLKPLLDERVQHKIHILGRNYLDELSTYIPLHELPEEFGGKGGKLKPIPVPGKDYKLEDVCQAVGFDGPAAASAATREIEPDKEDTAEKQPEKETEKEAEKEAGAGEKTDAGEKEADVGEKTEEKDKPAEESKEKEENEEKEKEKTDDAKEPAKEEEAKEGEKEKEETKADASGEGSEGGKKEEAEKAAE
eukprot:TRINITY_DN62571_c0_g1_i1.p1 TRINITY_DN62571_c0_g1~~TRINITY_DN62571_c0_g1_i1.p1  ORF type:complete len:425 (-),score=88.94 TRINITY_DN62571_c0_g1_i1:868-2142(-)